MAAFPVGGPLGVVIMLLLGGLGAPFPEELVLAGGGIAAHPELRALAVVVAAGYVGVLGGDMLVYALGRFIGEGVRRHPLLARHLSEEKLGKFEGYLARRGPKIIFALRFMTGLRAPAFFSAGAMRFPAATFLLYDGLAALVSVPVFAGLGFVLGSHFSALQKDLKQVGVYVGIIAVVAVLGYAAYRWWKAEQGQTEPN
jgi:membrane protein DedA with SNARE-associated domain